MLAGAVLVTAYVLVLAVVGAQGHPTRRPQDALLAAARGVDVLARLVERAKPPLP